jgi:hypothetical protein
VIDEDRTLPAVLVQAHLLWLREFDHSPDLDPGDMFEGSAETTEWWREVTNNPAAGVAPFRVFGRESSGGFAAIWTQDLESSVETQPIVFLGSEGEIGVIARDLGDYLWLLGSGVGPVEAIFGLDRVPEPIPALVALAHEYRQAPARTAETVKDAAGALLPALTAFIESVCRYERSAPRPIGKLR